MTRVEVVVLVLSVLAAQWALKKLRAVLARTALLYAHKKRMCELCFLQEGRAVPADYECNLPEDEEEGEHSFLICHKHIEKLVPDREKLIWCWDKGYVKKA